MFSFFKKLFRQKQKPEFQIFVDIGTTCASMVVAEKRDNGFFLSSKTRFEVQETDRDAGQQKIQRFMQDYIISVIKEHGRVPQKMHIGVSGAMLENRFETVHLTRKNQQKKLTEVELQELIQDGLVQFSKPDANTALAYFFVTRIALDGYAIQELPHAAYPATVAISFFLSFAPQDYWKALTGMTSAFGGFQIQFYPNQYLAGTVLPRLLGIRDGVFVDIGGTVTEVSVVSGQKLSYVARIDYGGEQMTEHFAEFLNMHSKKDAKNLKRQYSHFWFSSDQKTRALEDGLRESARVWREKLDAVFASVYTVIVPDAFFLFGGGANFPPVIAALEETDGERSAFLEKITVKKNSAEDIALPYAPGSERLYGSDAVMLAALIAQAYGK
ncbi:hypothetical protein KGQ34_03770 [Patescibacteria group bacterium]|nr:hypothetical protein [Patescibacteria group bacterium]